MAKLAYMVGLLAAGGVSALLACSPFGGASAFTCTTDEQCSGGQCELDGLCSFVSAACPSGREYGPNSGDKSNECVPGGTPVVDAPPDMAPPTTCTAGQQECFGHVLETCNATGTGFDPAMQVVCPLTCLTSPAPACVAASNLAATDQAGCGPTAPALTPPAGATVTINAGQIDCAPNCSAGVTSIPRTGATPNDWYCLSAVNLEAGVTIARGTVTGAVTLFSHGAATIDATIDFSGGDATGSLNGNGSGTPGAGGPGGFAGGPLSNNNASGNPGLGACPGGAGTVAGANQTAAGGGGGGAGHQALGGTGGNGRSGVGAIAAGGTAGVITCDSPEGRPLGGGSGGGGGADGSCGVNVACGWPGGGGGGALQIVSRVSINGAGALRATGGDGFGETTEAGGGGGGGAGGTLLLEAPAFALTGGLVVDGGTGGTSAGGTGGAGGTTATSQGQPGTSAAVNGRGGGGGGGAGGRVRINASTGASCANASPSGGCTTGALRTAP